MSTLDNLRKTAKRWLKALRANDADARARLARAYPAAPSEPGLRDVQHALARERGHASWTDLTKAAERPAPAASPPSTARGGTVSPAPPPPAEESPDADVPYEMRIERPFVLQDGVLSTTSEVWEMLCASRDGDLERVTEFVSRKPSLVHCDHNYMRPLHLAVREGHVDLVRHLLEQGAADPIYETYPYRESVVTIADDREYTEIRQLLEDSLARPDLPTIGDSGRIEYGKSDVEQQFQKLVASNKLAEVDARLRERPGLALDPDAFWSEGILSAPANGRRREMLELLIANGARVPERSKWAMEYYFKHYDIAVYLMQQGMNARHMNWHRTTLLHEMARIGDRRKAELLLDYGADVNAIDQEFRSTPLGFAARWGQRAMIGVLLGRGADPNLSAAPWSTPLAWAHKTGHDEIAADLRQAGAH